MPYNEVEVRIHVQRVMALLQGRTLFRESVFSDLVSPSVVKAVPTTLTHDNVPGTWRTGPGCGNQGGR